MAKPHRFRDKWRIRWFDHEGRRRSGVFETFREAERELSLRLAEVELIRRGRRDAPPEDRSYDDLADYWLSNRAIHKRSGGDDRSMIRRHLRPTFGALRLREIGVPEIDRYKAVRRHLRPKTVRNHLILLGTMLRLAVDLGWLHKMPRIDKPKVRAFSTDYRYLRTEDEVRRLLRAARDEGDDTFAMYATAIFTGMRAGELAALTWACVDFDTGLITIQASFDGLTKSGDVRYVPILDGLRPVLCEWRLKCHGRLVFPNQVGAMHQPSARIFQERLHRVLDAAGFPRPPATRREKHHVHFHGLRHTFASHWVMNGGDLFKLQKVLGHKSVEMTMRYAHLAPAAFAADRDRLNVLAPFDPAVRPLGTGSLP